MGDVWPVPGGGEAASLLGTSPEQRKRSMPSSIRLRDGSGWLRFPPLWETSGLSLVAVGLHLVVCDEWCMMCVVLCPVVLCCVVLRCVVLC